MRFHDKLNPKLWDEFELKEEVKDKLEEITEAFIEYLDIPAESILDVQITGSSANYNYTEHSDLDLHLIVDYEKVHQECPIVEGYLWSMKSAFNKEHDIFIYGVPVEVYAEDSSQSAVSNGVYSLLNDEWIKKPQKIEPTTNDAAVIAKYNEIKDIVDKLNDSEEAQDILDKVYEMRKAGLAEAGEFSTENLAFKMLRNEGYIDMLKKIKKQKIDKQLTLESYNESVSSNKLKNELENKIKQFFKNDEDALDWAIVDITEDDNEIKVEVRVELGYNGMWNLSDMLNPIVSKYDKYAYFDFEQPGIMVAVIERKNSARNNRLESFQSLDRYKLTNKDDYNKAVKAIDDIINSKESISKEEYGELLKAISRNEKEAHSGSFTIDYEMVKDEANMQRSKILKLYKNSKNEAYIKKVTKDEWNRTHNDYKTIINGKKYMMYLDPEKHMTVLGPVEIINNTNESIKEDSIDDIVNSLINKYGKEKLQKGLQTPYQKDYIWGLLHREKGLDLTAILNCLKSKLNESIKEDYEWKGPIARVTFDNGEVMETAINGSDEEIKSYYLGRTFNLGIEKDDMHKAVKVEVIRESKSIKELNREIEELLKD